MAGEWECVDAASQGEDEAVAEPLFSRTECALVRQFMEFGASRDEAVVGLVEHSWNLAEAVLTWSEETSSASDTTPILRAEPPLQRDGAERNAASSVSAAAAASSGGSGLSTWSSGRRGRCRHCARSRAWLKEVCCVGCPARHTRTCGERFRREQGVLSTLVEDEAQSSGAVAASDARQEDSSAEPEPEAGMGRGGRS